MEASRSSEAGVEKVVKDLSSYLASTLTSLGYERHGLDRDDLLQEIHIKIWKSLREDGPDIQYFNAYLKKIVYSVLVDEINRVEKENGILERGGPCLRPYDGSVGVQPVDANEVLLGNILAASIDDLKESKRRVFKLRLQGFTLNEIARLNQWPYRKTCSLFYRGLKDLKRKLGERGVRYED